MLSKCLISLIALLLQWQITKLSNSRTSMFITTTFKNIKCQKLYQLWSVVNFISGPLGPRVACWSMRSQTFTNNTLIIMYARGYGINQDN
jgi:hypothetical protein